ncbi:MAG: hypothetical protein CME62_09850 [Halobacteriovoraceae bacterium]|nr:hypothetical protein [Halobacteriovoraceae bacterium]|tara:strand:+ start:6575 stop:7096 length:522 start_codon:yes stop_codon:yes gene_type:complete
MVKRIKDAGFSLIEVMIALAIFAVFAVSIISTQSANIHSSIRMSQDLVLHNLAEMKMNEALLGKREFTNVTDKDPETGSIDIDGYKDFKFEIAYKKNEFPDFAQILGQDENEEERVQRNDPNAGVRKQIFNKLKGELEKLLWQITVTIIHPDGTQYSLSSWVTRGNVRVELNL